MSSRNVTQRTGMVAVELFETRQMPAPGMGVEGIRLTEVGGFCTMAVSVPFGDGGNPLP
jgi:hypothetical protein